MEGGGGIKGKKGGEGGREGGRRRKKERNREDAVGRKGVPDSGRCQIEGEKEQKKEPEAGGEVVRARAPGIGSE
eukprot:1959202-Pleurochrysis_carterae.AAC.1